MSERRLFSPATASHPQSEGPFPRKGIAAARRARTPLPGSASTPENGEALGGFARPPLPAARASAAAAAARALRGSRLGSGQRGLRARPGAPRGRPRPMPLAALPPPPLFSRPRSSPARGRRSPPASVGKGPSLAAARGPHAEVCGLPCSARVCGWGAGEAHSHGGEWQLDNFLTGAGGSGNALLISGAVCFSGEARLENRLV